MDYLWTPWRYQYVTSQGKADGCVFCTAASSADDRANFVVHRGKEAFVILNRFPYTNGHIMIVPYQHVSTLEELGDEALVEMMRLARTADTRLREIYPPDGLNLGMNLGKSAGAGIAEHLHLHALPRWVGDANFMTVTAETRVHPETLATTYRRFKEAFATLQ